MSEAGDRVRAANERDGVPAWAQIVACVVFGVLAVGLLVGALGLLAWAPGAWVLLSIPSFGLAGFLLLALYIGVDALSGRPEQ